MQVAQTPLIQLKSLSISICPSSSSSWCSSNSNSLPCPASTSTCAQLTQASRNSYHPSTVPATMKTSICNRKPQNLTLKIIKIWKMNFSILLPCCGNSSYLIFEWIEDNLIDVDFFSSSSIILGLNLLCHNSQKQSWEAPGDLLACKHERSNWSTSSSMRTPSHYMQNMKYENMQVEIVKIMSCQKLMK